MGKVDCVMEACQESYDKGAKDISIEIAKNLLKDSIYSPEEISKLTGVDLDKIMELKEDL